MVRRKRSRNLFKQLLKSSCHLRPGERFRNQQDSVSIPGSKAHVSLVLCVSNDDDGKPDMVRVVTQAVEECLAHIEGGTVQHDSIGALLCNQLIDGRGVSCCDDLMSPVTQRKGQQLGNLRRVVDE
jgi:hypothetical protein